MASAEKVSAPADKLNIKDLWNLIPLRPYMEEAEDMLPRYADLSGAYRPEFDHQLTRVQSDIIRFNADLTHLLEDSQNIVRIAASDTIPQETGFTVGKSSRTANCIDRETGVLREFSPDHIHPATFALLIGALHRPTESMEHIAKSLVRSPDQIRIPVSKHADMVLISTGDTKLSLHSHGPFAIRIHIRDTEEISRQMSAWQRLQTLRMLSPDHITTYIQNEDPYGRKETFSLWLTKPEDKNAVLAHLEQFGPVSRVEGKPTNGLRQIAQTTIQLTDGNTVTMCVYENCVHIDLVPGDHTAHISLQLAQASSKEPELPKDTTPLVLKCVISDTPERIQERNELALAQTKKNMIGFLLRFDYFSEVQEAINHMPESGIPKPIVDLITRYKRHYPDCPEDLIWSVMQSAVTELSRALQEIHPKTVTALPEHSILFHAVDAIKQQSGHMTSVGSLQVQ